MVCESNDIDQIQEKTFRNTGRHVNVDIHNTPLNIDVNTNCPIGATALEPNEINEIVMDGGRSSNFHLINNDGLQDTLLHNPNVNNNIQEGYSQNNSADTVPDAENDIGQIETEENLVYDEEEISTDIDDNIEAWMVIKKNMYIKHYSNFDFLSNLIKLLFFCVL